MNLVSVFCKPQLETIKQLQDRINKLQTAITDVQTLNASLEETNNKLRSQLANPAQVIIKQPVSAIDTYLTSKYTKVDNIAYTGKRTSAIPQLKKVVSGSYNVFLNEFITPTAWEVINFKRGVSGVDDVVFFQNLGAKFKPLYKWLNEIGTYASSDEYLYPAETLTFMIQNADCEDVSFMTCSMRPEICAVAYGIYHNQIEKKDYGHCYPVYVYKDELYVVEFTTTNFEMVKLPDCRYDTYFYITKDNTYRVKDGVAFGLLADWR